ncbi:molybdenum cofactor synthesis domain-containing protein [Bacteroidota bacterium]
MKALKIISVNISEEKGTVKHPVDEIELCETGIRGDAHGGKWHRQISLLAKESIEKAEMEAGTSFPDGTFAENITTQGIELHTASILDRFMNANVELEVTQIGKKCHAKCAIGNQVGNCIMPVEGIFARVLRGGVLKPGDRLEYQAKTFKIKIITLSDRAAAGEYEDMSGPEIQVHAEMWGKENRLKIEFTKEVIPDEKALLENSLKEAFLEKYDLVFTTGSTGIGPRDIAPEVISGLLEKEIPGIMELVRMKYGMDKPNALLSRSLCGVHNKTLIFALPGSPKAVKEYMQEINKVLFHSILMVHDIGNH